MNSAKFKVGDSVSLKSDPTESWLVVKVLDPLPVNPYHRYRIVNPHSHERTVFEGMIEHIK